MISDKQTTGNKRQATRNSQLATRNLKSTTVTILIPCYQQGQLLGQAVASARAQTHTDLDIVIVNDGATDSTAQVAAKLAEADPERVRVIEQDNQGQARARQAGLEIAKGQFLVTLDADDLLEPAMVETCLRTFKEHPDADVVAGDAWMVAGDGETILRRFEQGRGEMRWPDILEYNPLGAVVATMTRAESVRRAGGLAVDGLSGCEDWDLWARMARCGMRFVRIPEVVGRYRQTNQSFSRRALHMLRAQIELLDRCAKDDPRLGDEKTATAIAPEMRGRLVNGRVFYALGVALTTCAADEEIESILECWTAGRWDGRFNRMQCVWGLQINGPVGGEVGKPVRERLAERVESILPIVRRHTQQANLDAHEEEIVHLLRRSAADPTYKRPLWERIKSRLKT